ncbi:MAG: sigma-70 family RNA polymerase sigma factor [Clostridia bacterium]|nr:sigma-70 family RNA polymerase sigma factor [Clostridia bacterium]
MKDIDIIKLYFARSEKAIDETDKKYGAYCICIAKNILFNNQDSEECVNDTYLRAWNSIPPKEPHNLRTYLGKITRGLAINRYKLYSAEKRGGSSAELVLSELEGCIPSGMSVEDTLDEKLLIKAVEDFLRRQSTEKRNIFLRRYWYCSSVSDIARDFSMSESKVTSLLYRQRHKLREHLEREEII